MSWNSGPMIGGATHWPNLNRHWRRPDPRDRIDQADDLTADGTVDDSDTDTPGDDDEGTERP